MTAEMSEDVVLQISSPQILTTLDVGHASGAGAGGGGGGGRSGAFSGSVELGRRLLQAARLGHTAQVLDLMAKGAPFTTDWLGTSPLHLAAAGAHAETCAVLLRAGVSRDSRTKVERTPLHLAAHAGHAAVAALLLEHGALADCRDMLRMTPLHWAAERGHGAAAAALLRHGADPHALSKFHKSPRALAAARGHAHILRLMDDALRDREAASSVHALREANESEEITEIPAAEQQRALESIERLQETVKPTNKQQVVHTEPIKIEFERRSEGSGGEGGGGGGGGARAGSGGAAQLLRSHGITLLPRDDTSTVLNAIQSGRTVVLSDAGKLMLKESSSPLIAAPAPSPTPAPASVSKGVILTAAPVKSPPKPGVKIFTLSNKLLAMPKENKAPIRKVVNPQDMQIKFVSFPSDSKLLSASKTPLKAKSRLRPAPAPAPVPRAPVKIIMDKANFDKMMAGKGIENGTETTTTTTASELARALHVSSSAAPAPAPAAMAGAGTAGGGVVVCVPQEFLSSNSSKYLRAQLLAAHRTIHELQRQLAALQERLARHEPV